LRSGHKRRCLPERRPSISKARVGRYIGEREAGAKPRAGVVQLNFAQGLDVTEAHERPRNLLPPFHVGQQVRAARERHGIGSLAVQNPRSFCERQRRAELEKWQPHHGASTFSSRGFFRRGTSFTALPSPPSQGGGTG